MMHDRSRCVVLFIHHCQTFHVCASLYASALMSRASCLNYIDVYSATCAYHNLVDTAQGSLGHPASRIMKHALLTSYIKFLTGVDWNNQDDM